MNKTITLSVDSYKGVDGTSLSSARCSQIVQVYEMLERIGGKEITYLELQDEAAKNELFPRAKSQKSVIRTIFPLLKKIEFVNYEGAFPANKCFTNLGTQFVLACRALENVTDKTPHKYEIISRLENIKRNAQRIGLIKMYNNPDYKSHNMWIALKLLKELRIMHWNEFLYTLHCREEGKSVDDAIADIKSNKKEIDEIVFVNEKDEVLANTCYSYLRSYLEEAGLISKVSSLVSKLLDEAEGFYAQINL